MAKLASRHCTALKKGTKPLSASVAKPLLAQIDASWHMTDDAISRRFEFSDFNKMIGFVNAVAWIANHEDHHPELELNQKRCLVRLTSHIAKGLTVNDFICAAKIDALMSGMVPTEKTSTTTATPKVTPTKKQEKEKTSSNESDLQQTLAFNPDEADELLNQQPVITTPDNASHDDDEDEFELIDPDEDTEATAREAAKKVKETKTAKKTTSKTRKARPQRKRQKAKAPESDELMSTMVIPPDEADALAKAAMETNKVTANRAPTPSQPTATTAPDALDMEKTMVIPITGEDLDKTLDKTLDTTEIPIPSENDPDEVRTMILATTENIDVTIPPVAAETEPAPPPAEESEEEEEDVEKTMLLSSNPLQAQQKQKNNLSSADPGIEDDETLVMHANTYKTVDKEKSGN